MAHKVMTQEELAEAFIISQPDLWAEAFLRSPMDPANPLILRDYQRDLLRDDHHRLILRLGRRTGKSVALGAKALNRAFTRANRQVLVTAAYETQVDGVFDLIRRMAFDSPDIAAAIANYRRKPYELWFKNGSVIRGLVANSSVRGKCLAKGSQVWMADRSWKPIETIKPGESVVCYDDETQQATTSQVVNFFENGVREVFEIRTTSARRLIATANHPLFAYTKGWTNVEDLKDQVNHGSAADFIGVADVFGDLNWARIHSIVPFGKLPTYDIEVENYHHFVSFYPNSIEESGFAESGLGNGGIFVHNSADDLIIDEADYIPENILLEDLWPIATTYRHTSVTMSSTPTGRREFFWKVSVNRHKPEFDFHEFHIPSWESPEWTPEQESLVRAITTQGQFDREYGAEFGEAVEGVFRNTDIDKSMHVYGYEDLVYNPNNYYTLGVDWNEPKHGVQIVVLEYLNDPVKVLPFKSNTFKLNETEQVRNKFRVFRVDMIDAKEYINTKAVDQVLKVMMEIKPHYSLFDHGHGHTNWELLRLAIKKGKTSTGMSVHGIKHLLERMDVLDFSSSIETIDPITKATMKHKAKNFIVKLAVNTLEHGRFIQPAVDRKGVPVEDNDRQLVPQMREYSIARRGEKGEVYEAGKSGDHRLDATMLAIYAYGLEHDEFLSFNFDVEPQTASDVLTPRSVHRQLTDTTANPVGYSRTSSGILVRNYGKWAGKGEPPEEEENSSGLTPRRGRSSRKDSKFTRRGDRGL